MSVLSMETASRIWKAHREIETAKKLLAEIEEGKNTHLDPTPMDPLRRTRDYQLGVPSGCNGHRLFGVNPTLASAIIQAHILANERELQVDSDIARAELADDPS